MYLLVVLRGRKMWTVSLDSTSGAVAKIQARNYDGNVFLKSAKNPVHSNLWFGGINRRNLFSLSFFFNNYYLM